MEMYRYFVSDDGITWIAYFLTRLTFDAHFVGVSHCVGTYSKRFKQIILRITVFN